MISLNRKLKNSFDIKNIIIALKEIVNDNGIFMFDAFNWDFVQLENLIITKV